MSDTELPRLMLGICTANNQILILGFGWTVEECNAKAEELKAELGISEYRSFKVGDLMGQFIDRWLLLNGIKPNERVNIIRKVGILVLEMIERPQ